jgi:CopG family nickel-responsive transcriptional regulator
MTEDRLVRFGVAMESELLTAFDAYVAARGGTRSEAIRDLVRAKVSRTQVKAGLPAVAALTLVYDHHVRDLTEKLTEIQHELGDKVRSTMHVHLDHDHCLEVIIMRGAADELEAVAERVLATRGVTHGGIEIVSDFGTPAPRSSRGNAHGHAHGHPHPHPHVPAGGSSDAPKPRKSARDDAHAPRSRKGSSKA